MHIPPNQLSIGEQLPTGLAVTASSVPRDVVIKFFVAHPHSITHDNRVVNSVLINYSLSSANQICKIITKIPIITKKAIITLFISIPSMGLEPILPNGKQILSLSRLPVPPQGQSTPSRIRTYDPRLRRPLLCPLSYRSTRVCPPALGLSPSQQFAYS